MKKLAVILLCYALAVGLWAEGQVKTPATGQTDEADNKIKVQGNIKHGKFSEDIAGYHADGYAEASAKEEAIRLAKASALNFIFIKTGKDEMFKEMFISSWPGSITVEKTEVKETKQGFSAVVTVKIDRNSVIMTEDRYRVSATELLDRAAKIIVETGSILNDAETAEANLRMSEALIGYQHASTRCNEAKELLKHLGSNSIVSSDGKNLASILSIIDSLKLRADTGLKRLEELAKKNEKTKSMEEIGRALDLISIELSNIEKTVLEYSKIEPFYDLPKERLQSILIDVNSFINRNRDIKDKLNFLSGKVTEKDLFLKERIEIKESDLKRSDKMLVKMKEELNLEINEPRLLRQEKARKREERRKAFKDAALYLFIHKPSELLSFRYYIPISWDGEKKFSFTGENNWILQSEGLLAGFWIRGNLSRLEMEMLQSRSNTLSSEIAIGIAQKVLFGVGFSWEWMHGITDGMATNGIDTAGMAAINSGIKENAVTLFFGGPNSKKTRINWLVGFTYRIPLFFDYFIAAYQMNAGLNWLVRAGDILLVEADVSSGCYQRLPSATTDAAKNRLEYQLRWKAGVAFRLPYPFTWGIYYKGTGKAPLNGNTLGALNYDGTWNSYIGYHF